MDKKCSENKMKNRPKKIRNYDKKNKPNYAIILYFSNIMFSQN